MEFFGHDLRNHQRDEKAQEEQGSDEIAPIERQGYAVAASLA